MLVNGTKPGVIAFIGKTQFAAGEWAGVILDELKGNNDGKMAGMRYFTCQPLRGLFAKTNKLVSEDIGAPLSRGASAHVTNEGTDELTRTEEEEREMSPQLSISSSALGKERFASENKSTDSNKDKESEEEEREMSPQLSISSSALGKERFASENKSTDSNKDKVSEEEEREMSHQLSILSMSSALRKERLSPTTKKVILLCHEP